MIELKSKQYCSLMKSMERVSGFCVLALGFCYPANRGRRSNSTFIFR